MKITRAAFLYLSPKEPRNQFADCQTCRLYLRAIKRCAILPGPVQPEDSCGLYIHGKPNDRQPMTPRVVTREEAGFVTGPVRCENCAYGGDHCRMFAALNATLPQMFDLDETIDPKGCCNGWVKADD